MTIRDLDFLISSLPRDRSHLQNHLVRTGELA